MWCIRLACTASLVKILYKSDFIWGSNPWKTTQKQPKIVLSAPTETFNNFTTENAILMKLTSIMYLYETFHMAKSLGITHGV